MNSLDIIDSSVDELILDIEIVNMKLQLYITLDGNINCMANWCYRTRIINMSNMSRIQLMVLGNHYILEKG